MTHRIRRLLFACVCLTVVACAKDAPEETESQTVVPVSTATATRGSITAFVHATGVVTPAPGAELIVVAPETARIVAIPKAEGDTVRRGDLLVRFEIPSAVADVAKQRAEITRAEARLANARAAQARAKDLFERGVAARKELEDADKEIADAEADLAGAHAATTAAETVAARSEVHATFDGVIVKRSHNPGDLVEASAGDAVVRVVDLRRLEVAASVPVDAAPRVKVGAAARLANQDAMPVRLTVVSRPAAVTAGTATVPVRLSFMSPPGYPVGTPVQVDIEAETHNDAILVPASAIVHEGDMAAVYVAEKDVAKRKPVAVGIEGDKQVEITKGIDAGEVVITSGQNGLPDGAKISIAAPARASEP
jgi:RND family efflux transporter MFP subunit